MKKENMVLRAIERAGGQSRLAERLAAATGHPYKHGHVGYWKRVGHFPEKLAHVISTDIFNGEVSMLEVCPGIKRSVHADRR